MSIEVTIAPAPDSEFSAEFVRGMATRMALSYYKYGQVAEAYPAKVDAIVSLELRLRKYKETGNTEFLMDAANFAMIEFMHPRHPSAYYKATDSHESPGRQWISGEQSQRRNNSDPLSSHVYKNDGD